MIKIHGIGATNFRSLKNLGVINLKPITILVGKNSAGKSTFARILPLLKQSAERSKTAPILWWGRLVDFGMFDDVYSSTGQDGLICITIRFSTDEPLMLSRRFGWRTTDIKYDEPRPIDVTFKLGKEDDGKTTLREIQLNVYELKIELSMGAGTINSVKANGQSIEIPSNIKLSWNQGNLLPIIRTINIAPTQTGSVSDESLFLPRRVSRFGAAAARRAVSRFVHGNTQEDRLDEIVDRLPIAPTKEFLEFCKNLPGATVTWKNLISQATPESSDIKNLQLSTTISKLDMLFAVLDEASTKFLTGVSYLEPLRATAQRYYRREEISIDELDPKGLNTPFFVQGLSKKESESLQNWTANNFGFALTVKSTGGHVSLNIQSTDEKSVSRNMADVGLGYSQLVPVAVQLWAARRRHTTIRKMVSSGRYTYVDERPLRTVVVEQPELHLHPAYQARLADVFAAAIKPEIIHDGRSSDTPLSIIAETHSPNLIARLGELIDGKTLSADQVQILVFEESSNPDDGTHVRVATFNNKGVLSNWPIGFFDA